MTMTSGLIAFAVFAASMPYPHSPPRVRPEALTTCFTSKRAWMSASTTSADGVFATIPSQGPDDVSRRLLLDVARQDDRRWLDLGGVPWLAQRQRDLVLARCQSQGRGLIGRHH